MFVTISGYGMTGPYRDMPSHGIAYDVWAGIVEPKIEETLDHLTRSLEEPFADSSMLPTYYVCRMARQHVTVALSGDGGDELFAGYDRYAISLARQGYNRIPAWLGRMYRQGLHPHLPRGMYGRNFAWNASLIAHYRCSQLFGAFLGYRALSLDWEDLGPGGRTAYNLSMFGPIVGISFTL